MKDDGHTSRIIRTCGSEADADDFCGDETLGNGIVSDGRDDRITVRGKRSPCEGHRTDSDNTVNTPTK